MSEELVLNEVKHIKNGIDKIEGHLNTLNSKVQENTKFRIEGRTYLKLIGGVLSVLAVPIIILIIDRFLIHN